MPNLPNLSNSRSFLAASPNSFSYNNGSESYRDKVREKIQSNPRKNNGEYTSRSIDLSLSREKTFRSKSRNQGNNLITDFENDNNDFNGQRDRLKSGRYRQKIYFNNNSQASADRNNENNDNQHDYANFNNNQENLDFINTDRIENEAENSYVSRKKRFEDNNFNQNVNGFNDSAVKFKERIKTARESTRTPLITPRKSCPNDNNLEMNSNRTKTPLKTRNQDTNDQEIFPGINTNFQDDSFRSKNSFNSRKLSRNSSHNSTESNKVFPDENNQMRSNSRINLNDDDNTPVPMPRKRDVSSKLLQNEPNDFRIKRVSSSKPMNTPRSSYLPSTPRSNQKVPQLQENQLNNGHDFDRRSRRNNDQTPLIKSDTLSPDNAEEFFKNGARREISGINRRSHTKIDIGIEPKLEPRHSNKSRLTFD